MVTEESHNTNRDESSAKRAASLFMLMFLLSCIVEVNDLYASSCSSAAGGPTCGDGNSLGSSQPVSNINQYAGNPVNMINGNKYQGDMDFKTADSLLMFKRHYNSINAMFNLGLGHGWRNTYDVSLVNQGRDKIAIIQSDGRIIHFRRTIEETSTKTKPVGDQTIVFIPKAENDGILKITNTTQEWQLGDGRRFYFKGPFLTKIIDQRGQSVSLYYQDQRLQTVTDHLGRILTLTYTPGAIRSSNLGLYSEDSESAQDRGETDNATATLWPGHLAAITLPGGKQIEYKYDNRGQLLSVRYSEGQVTDYHYANKLFNGILTERLKNKQTTAKWHYDESGRVSRYDNMNNGSYLNFDYADIDGTSTEGSTTVTDHIGGSTKYEWQRLGPEKGEQIGTTFDEYVIE